MYKLMPSVESADCFGFGNSWLGHMFSHAINFIISLVLFFPCLVFRISDSPVMNYITKSYQNYSDKFYIQVVIIKIKSHETTEGTYTCSYTSENLIPTSVHV